MLELGSFRCSLQVNQSHRLFADEMHDEAYKQENGIHALGLNARITGEFIANNPMHKVWTIVFSILYRIKF